MQKNMRLHTEMAVIGGASYNLIEILWRGRTHWSMFLVGGLCFELIGGVNTRLSHRPLLWRGTVCAAGITAVEFVSGCVVNRALKMQVWDYSHMPLNIGGQICLLYSVYWVLLSMAAWPCYRGCRRALLKLHAR